jgi:hypothetical protein
LAAGTGAIRLPRQDGRGTCSGQRRRRDFVGRRGLRRRRASFRRLDFVRLSGWRELWHGRRRRASFRRRDFVGLSGWRGLGRARLRRRDFVGLSVWHGLWHGRRRRGSLRPRGAQKQPSGSDRLRPELRPKRAAPCGWGDGPLSLCGHGRPRRRPQTASAVTAAPVPSPCPLLAPSDRWAEGALGVELRQRLVRGRSVLKAILRDSRQRIGLHIVQAKPVLRHPHASQHRASVVPRVRRSVRDAEAVSHGLVLRHQDAYLPQIAPRGLADHASSRQNSLVGRGW